MDTGNCFPFAGSMNAIIIQMYWDLPGTTTNGPGRGTGTAHLVVPGLNVAVLRMCPEEGGAITLQCGNWRPGW